MNKNIEALMDLNKFGIKLGLDNMVQLAQAFNNPHEKLKIIHVAGTNGKGSTTRMTAKMLENAGYQVCTYTSPFVTKLNENFRINDEMINDQELDEFARLVLEVIDQQKIKATHYEVCTMIVFLYAKKHNVDYLILEVGLGGRFDATNIVQPIISIITNVSLDHTSILGHTITEIANEKTGIIKPNTPVIIGETSPEFSKVLTKYDNKMYETSNLIDDVKLDYQSLQTIVNIKGKTYNLNLFGKHQAYNFAIVYQIAQLLKVEEHHLLKMADEIKWDYRFQIYSREPLIILDGAHNIASLKALKEALSNYPKNQVQVVFSALADKEIEKMAQDLQMISDNIIVTSLNKIDESRGLSAKEVAKRLKINVNIIEENQIAFAKINSNPYPVNAICGSFQLLQAFEKNNNK